MYSKTIHSYVHNRAQYIYKNEKKNNKKTTIFSKYQTRQFLPKRNKYYKTMARENRNIKKIVYNQYIKINLYIYKSDFIILKSLSFGGDGNVRRCFAIIWLFQKSSRCLRSFWDMFSFSVESSFVSVVSDGDGFAFGVFV